MQGERKRTAWTKYPLEKDKPFFLMMHHKAPHRNWVPAERHYHLFDEVDFPVPDSYFDD